VNERIRELAEQCWINDGGPDSYFSKEKFAELIIKECAEFIRYKAEKSMSQEILYVGNDLLTHFGIE
jgi:hypothetical protein